MKQTTTLTLVETGAALDEIERRKAQLSAALAGVGLELERAEAELGERVLAGHEDAMRDVLELRTRADGLNAALAALEKRRAAALLDQNARRLWIFASRRRRSVSPWQRSKALRKRCSISCPHWRTFAIRLQF